MKASVRGRCKRSASGSSYSFLVASSLKGTSIIKSNPLGPTPTADGNALIIDDERSFANVVITFEGASSFKFSLLDPKGRSDYPGVVNTNAVIFNIENTMTGKWVLRYSGPGKYGFTVSVTFKQPIAIDIRFFYPESPRKLIMIQRTLSSKRRLHSK